MKGSCPYLHIEWLHNDASLLSPKLLQGENESLEGASVCFFVHALADLLG